MIVMNKSEIKDIALSKAKSKINAIINSINTNIKTRAEHGFFTYTFTYSSEDYGIMNIVLQDFHSRGFNIDEFNKENFTISIGWFN